MFELNRQHNGVDIHNNIVQAKLTDDSVICQNKNKYTVVCKRIYNLFSILFYFKDPSHLESRQPMKMCAFKSRLYKLLNQQFFLRILNHLYFRYMKLINR